MSEHLQLKCFKVDRSLLPVDVDEDVYALVDDSFPLTNLFTTGELATDGSVRVSNDFYEDGDGNIVMETFVWDGLAKINHDSHRAIMLTVTTETHPVPSKVADPVYHLELAAA